MKILHVVSSMDPSEGGVCQAIRNSILPLEQLGVVNEVLCLDSIDANYGFVDPFLVHKIGPRRGPYSYVRGLTSWLKDNVNSFDIIIIHGIWQYHSFGTYLIWKKIKSQARFFVMPHGMLDPYFQRAPERRFKAIRNSFFWHLFEGRMINNIDGVLFTCRRELELARDTFQNYCPNQELNISLSVNEPPVYNEDMRVSFLKKSKLEIGDSYFLFLSRIHEKKGVDLLIQAYIRLKLINPTMPKLVIAGPINNTYAQKLMNSVNDRNDIIFTGMLQGNEKWGAIYGCEVFILPSHQENFGIAIVEAMACAKPVAITNQVNIYTEVEKYNAGYVFQDNLASTYIVLEHIFRDYKNGILAKKGNGALISYRDNFQPEKVGKKMKDILSTFLSY